MDYSILLKPRLRAGFFVAFKLKYLRLLILTIIYHTFAKAENKKLVINKWNRKKIKTDFRYGKGC